MLMLQRHSIICLLVLVIAVSCNQKAEEPVMPKQYTAEQLRNNIIAQAAGYNKDEEKILVSSNSTGIFNVYLLNVADTSMQPLTHSSTDACFAISFLPGTGKFIF